VEKKRGYTFEIDVPVRSEWANVDLLVTSVQNCFCAMFANVDGSHAIATVAGELLENAIKYGEWTDGEQHLRLQIRGEKGNAIVIVENPCNDPASVEQLRASIQWIEGFDSAKEAYCAKLVEVAARAPKAGMSGLGLARVAYEGGCSLEATVDRDASLVVDASGARCLVSVRASVPLVPPSSS
jgi:hypothetical protein